MFDYIIQLERQRILSMLSAQAPSTRLFAEADPIVAETNESLSLNEITAEAHTKVLLDLIYTYFIIQGFDDAADILTTYFHVGRYTEFQFIQPVGEVSIPRLCEQLHVLFLNSRFEMKQNKLVRSKSKERLIEKGAVYTQAYVTEEIVRTTIRNLGNISSSISVLDFACGTGRFYEAIVKVLSEQGISADNSVLNNVFAIDIDSDAINITRLKALTMLSEITDEGLRAVSRNILLKNGLMRKTIFDAEYSYIDGNDFGGRLFNGFDAVVSNPPYLVLKPNKSKEGKNNADRIAAMVSYFRNCGFYSHSIEGMFNLYQLSIESMLAMLKPGGEMGVICPSTLFADVSATKLRRHLLTANSVRAIKFFAERIPLFENVAQATNIFYLKKGGVTDEIELTIDEKSFKIKFGLVRKLFPDNLEIPFIGEEEWSILYKLSRIKKLKELPFVRNRRGELDLTLCKQYITTRSTPYRLVRGNMIGETSINDINGEYVSEGFLQTRSEEFLSKDFKHKRLICQQISNGGQVKRLKFVYCNENDILGNSCNYISSDEDTLSKLFLLLNSNILNWRFKITSSNNHINNYELDELPIVDLDLIDENFQYHSQKELDSYIGGIYGLTPDEINFVTK